jgi:hypothetical protein
VVPNDAIKIVQVGDTRSASTFQWYALCSIMRLKHPNARIQCNNEKKFDDSSDIQIHKTHFFTHVESIIETFQFNKIYVFVSSRGTFPVSTPQDHPNVYYVQVYEDFIKHGIASLQAYQPIFNLSDVDMKYLVQHLRYWDIIRLCCGNQQSLQNRLKLHNSYLVDTLSRNSEEYDYMNCDIYNLNKVEEEFLNSYLSKTYPKGLYAQHEARETIRTGFCDRTNAMIKSGSDFNYHEWNDTDPCQLTRIGRNIFTKVENPTTRRPPPTC